MDPKKQCLIINVINFLQDELVNGNLNDERKESVEVAIQCLETAFEVDNEVRKKFANDKVDLLAAIPTKLEVSEEDQKKAEIHKNEGNEYMKKGEYSKAVEEYTYAITLNPNNAVYWCNRAAAYSRMERHHDVIKDSKEAIRLDPQYGKAYGRLGIAFSNLSKFDEARVAYMNALKYDPNNAMYEANLKLAEERLFASMESAAPPEHRPMDISEFMNNPHIINMATQMLSNSHFRTLMSGIMSSPTDSVQENLNALLQAGQVLASRMESTDPNFVENLRRMHNPQNNTTSEASNADKSDKSNEPNKKSES